MRGAIGGALAGALAAGVIGGAWFRDPSTPTATTTPPAAVTTALRSSSGDVRSVVEKSQASVVAIEFTTTATQRGRTVQGTGAGSGVIISSDGLVLTNAHVVESATNLSVRLSDGSKYAATVVGSDTSSDIALLQLEGASNLPAAALGSSDALQVGDGVVAIGNALDLDGSLTVTSGIVSAKERSLTSSDNSVLGHLIQTDAAINSGNSGGPLLNMAGEVVGINTAIIQDSQNLGFSIAIDSVKPLIATLQN
ncbi:MAG TPA: trypsin-like peptidase domain-containing protein [Acidimicrobiales bacterium]|nr:trypsin-like peptidase domain-containing protein [Acidimicrobiales bacterium]